MILGIFLYYLIMHICSKGCTVVVVRYFLSVSNLIRGYILCRNVIGSEVIYYVSFAKHVYSF